MLADGRIITCDDQHDAELFWALRGAGAGSFGVVTELVFRPVPAPVVTVFRLAWPFSHATAVTRAWLGWAGTAPDQITARLTLAAGHDPDQPPTAEVLGAVLGHRSDAMGLLEQLTARVPASPATMLQEMPYRDALRHWAGPTGEQLDGQHSDSASRSCLYIKSEYFDRPLPPEAVTGLIAHLTADRRAGQARELDFTPWGGAYNRARRTATAFAHRTPLYLVKHTASAQPHAGEAETAAARRWARRSWQQLHRWGTGQVFPSFPDPDLRDWGHAYYGANYRRLLTVKARYDPGNRSARASRCRHRPSTLAYSEPTVRLRRYPRNCVAIAASKYSRRTPCSASGRVSTTRGEPPSSPGAIRSTWLPKAVQRAATLGSETPMWWKPSGWSGDQLPVPVISTSSR